MASEPTGSADTQLVYIPDHAARMCAKLLQQDQNKARLTAFVSAMGAGVQLLEDTLFDLLVGGSLGSATGATLDLWGAMVGEARGPLGDADYRRFIQARILVNVSGGTPDELLAIWRIVTGPDNVVRYLPLYPATFVLQVVRPSLMTEPHRRRVRRMMDDARPAGVDMELVEAVYGYFGFESAMAGNPPGFGFDVGKLSRIV